MISRAIDRCTEALVGALDKQWIIGYSGGKDSTAALKIFLSAAKRAKLSEAAITVIYCDTGVENPELDFFAKAALRRLSIELPLEFPNARVEILKAPVQERFFVRIIGRGYAPPSNRFRWCTKGLRILPVQRFLKNEGSNAVVVLGLRYGESVQRDRSLKSGASKDEIWQRQREGAAGDLLLPIIDFSLEQVWIAAQALNFPTAIDSIGLEDLYRGASEECPLVRSPLSPPCASGRFGCWTCTVVRRDKSTENMIRQGKTWLAPYLEFRNWLQQFREEREYRWPTRRNGVLGPGPFTVDGRKLILRRLQLLEADVDRELVSDEELRCISRLWEVDAPIEEQMRRSHEPAADSLALRL
jgi:DNA sulfur modification protein DndC